MPNINEIVEVECESGHVERAALRRHFDGANNRHHLVWYGERMIISGGVVRKWRYLE